MASGIITQEEIDWLTTHQGSFSRDEEAKALQDDLELTPRPFLKPAESVGMTEEELLAGGEHLKGTGHFRRYAAILFHRRAGFAANGMAVWNVPDDRAAEVGQTMASFSVVSHCYLRDRHPPQWPYNLFAMVHGRSRVEVEAKLRSVAAAPAPASSATAASTDCGDSKRI